MNKKRLPQIITVCALAALVVLAQGCAYFAKVKAINQRVDELKQDPYSMSMLTKPPAVNETVIGTYTSFYDESNSGTNLPASWAATYMRYNMVNWTIYHPANVFDPKRAIFNLLSYAKDNFPDIDLNELDVRSIEYKSTSFSMSVENKPDKNKNYPYTATNTYYFKGVVVRLPK